VTTNPSEVSTTDVFLSAARPASGVAGCRFSIKTGPRKSRGGSPHVSGTLQYAQNGAPNAVGARSSGIPAMPGQLSSWRDLPNFETEPHRATWLPHRFQASARIAYPECRLVRYEYPLTADEPSSVGPSTRSSMSFGLPTGQSPGAESNRSRSTPCFPLRSTRCA